MDRDFKEHVSNFIDRLKRESVRHSGDGPFETLMEGLSDGSIQFRWNLGGRLAPDYDDDKPDWLWLRYLISAPLIYAMIIPILIVDIAVSLYQAVCFRLWGIPREKRSTHVILDRRRLSYLNPIQKINCAYCGYANGVVAYARAIAGKTERYWCPVKHASEVSEPHDYYLEFSDYGDPEGWKDLHNQGMNGWGQD